MVLVLKKEVVKTNNAMEHEDTGKYRQLLVRTLHQCSVKFADVASTVIPVVCQMCSFQRTVLIFGRLFIKRFSLCYQTIVCLSVMSCPVLSVCDGRALRHVKT